MAAGKRAPTHAGARTEQARHGYVDCLAEAAPYVARMAKRSNSVPKRTESCRYCPGVEEADRPASPVSGCRLRCGDAAVLEIACLTVDAEAGFAWVVEVAEVVAAVEQSSVAWWTKASRPGRNFQ